MDDGKHYRIGQLSKLIGVSKDTIRHWQQKGLMKLERNESNYNTFSDNDYYDAFQINLLRDLGFSLSEIRDFLTTDRIEDRKDFISNQIQQLEKEIEKLTFQRDTLKKGLNIDPNSVVDCSVTHKVFKLKKLNIDHPSTFSILNEHTDRLVFLSNLDAQTDESWTTYIEVNAKEDFIYPHEMFIQFSCPKSEMNKLNESERLRTVMDFAKKQELQIGEEMIEVHDLKQLLYKEPEHIKIYVPVMK